MHYYQFHIGDYASHTTHLTNEEDLAYRRLLDLYYSTERPFNDCLTVARKIRISSEIVSIILQEFFIFDENIGWHHPRIEADIEKYKSRQTKASLAGKASGEVRRKNKTNERSTNVQRTLNQPITINQEPITNNYKKEKKLIKKESEGKKEPAFDALKILIEQFGVTEQVAKDWIAHRKNKKATITQTVITQHYKQAQEASLSLDDALSMACLRGWIGFKAEWALNAEKQHQNGFISSKRVAEGEYVGMTEWEIKQRKSREFSDKIDENIRRWESIDQFGNIDLIPPF
jgi:uncharacterized protein YdaU (DUF1376 family)